MLKFGRINWISRDQRELRRVRWMHKEFENARSVLVKLSGDRLGPLAFIGVLYILAEFDRSQQILQISMVLACFLL